MTTQQEQKLLILTTTEARVTTQSGRILQQIKERADHSAIVHLRTGIREAHQNGVLSLPLPECKMLDRFSAAISDLEERTHWLLRRRFFFQLKSLAARIIDFGKKERVSRVVALLDDPAIIWLTRRVANGLAVDYATYASSVPETMLIYAGFDLRSKQQMVLEFIDTVKQASAATFATQAMADFYRNNHQIAGITLSAPLRERQASLPAPAKTPVKIGCLIDPLFISGLSSLIEACQKNSWEINNQPIALTLIGSAKGLALGFNGQPADIELVSEDSETQVLEKLGACHFNFLPYWTGAEFSLSARLCLPERLQLYLSAERPLLLNALSTSLLCEITKNNKLGLNVASCTPDSFAQAAGELMGRSKDKDLGKNFGMLGQSAFAPESFTQAIDTLTKGGLKVS